MPYKIVRFHMRKKNQTIKTGLTKKEAQAHCRKKKTKGKSWFDGYTHYTGRKKRRRKR